MSHKKIGRSSARNLRCLLSGDEIAACAFTDKKLLKKLEEDRMVERLIIGRNRARLRCANPAGLRAYIRTQFGITNLEGFLELVTQKHCDGEESLSVSASTKALRRESLRGFFIKAFGAELMIGDDQLDAPPDGIEYFVRAPGRLKISPSALVVGVENPECFVKIERLLSLFLTDELVFVLRYHSASPVNWLKSVENPYLHFGDFDPAGIAIYCNEYLSRLGQDRCRFFVPPQIETLLLQRGSPDLYDRQAHLMPARATINQPSLRDLVDLIEKFGKALEQEHMLQI